MFNSCEECDYDYIFHRAADFAKHQADNVRIDTHENNLIMQRLIKKHGFVRCGTIYVDDGSPRFAYQWINTFPENQGLNDKVLPGRR